MLILNHIVTLTNILRQIKKTSKKSPEYETHTISMCTQNVWQGILLIYV